MDRQHPQSRGAEEKVNSIIRDEGVQDHEAIRYLHRRAFGREVEAQLVDALRNGGFVRVSLVAEIGVRIVGHVLFHEVHIKNEQESVPAVSLAPMAVLPEYHRRGIGSHLVRAGLDRCRHGGNRFVVVLGAPDFYRRFGFSHDLAASLDSPYGRDAFLAVELIDGALANVNGRVEYPPPFGAM